jgi:hypothetical protein
MKKIFVLVAVAMFTVAAFAQWSSPFGDIPAYHTAAPAPGTVLPPILSGSQLSGPNFQLAWQKAVYKDAAKVPKVLYQLPCFCRCDRALGHTSLHSCFEGLHGAECSTCAKEGYYAYKMTMQGKTVRQIRDGILHKDFEQIDLNSIGM